MEQANTTKQESLNPVALKILMRSDLKSVNHQWPFTEKRVYVDGKILLRIEEQNVTIIENYFDNRSNFFVSNPSKFIFTSQLFKQMLEILVFENLAKNLIGSTEIIDSRLLQNTVIEIKNVLEIKNTFDESFLNQKQEYEIQILNYRFKNHDFKEL